ncbi:MAG: UvrD-helicase domain-containing protein [Clostridiales bacterium]|nr:UvrD-helicase domain-containing protein [Clostridiales bacterium]
MYSLEELNEVQKRAVLDTEGAVLVTAGAGSGKTRLLTHRIAHLIKDLNVPPYNVLAITFTNKAANEMRTRLEKMLGSVDGIWICTFHAACVRILRRFIDRIGFDKNFTIYGEDETKSVIKRIVKQNQLNEDMLKRIISAISNAKSKGITPEEYEQVYKYSQDAQDIANAYSQYQSVLKDNNALDYDDLLIKTLYLLKTCEEARDYYQNKFRYIHIDEFQDTNTIQYDIAMILAGKHGNIFAVGDEDQCIYTWRGASIANIFQLQKDFDCKVYKLEQNYRSTSKILDIANKIIKVNSNRLDKKLWTYNDGGERVVCYCAATEGFEADYVIKTILDLVDSGEYNYSDCAVLLRANALSRHFEERFLQYGIAHRVYGGFKFYDRKEIKDVLAYARASVNPRDDEAVFRIINFPRRGIGDTSIEKIRDIAQKTGKSAFEVIVNATAYPLPTALKTKLADFGKLLLELNEMAVKPIVEYFKYLLYTVLNVDRLFSDDDDGVARLENLNELANSVRDFVKNNPDATLFDYLQTVSLYSDTDDMDEDNCVTVATVHSAKGLEFPVVFVVGLEDGIFPSLRQNENESAHMEEERRLMYVAVTRAKRRLFLTYAKSRFLYGETRYCIPSRFLSECGLVTRPERKEDVFTASPSHMYSPRNEQLRSPVNSSYGDNIGGGSSFTATYKSDFGKATDTKSQQVNNSEFAVGVSVMHKRLGKGKIIDMEKMGESMYLKIDFERGGVMLLAADFAPITVIKD